MDCDEGCPEGYEMAIVTLVSGGVDSIVMCKILLEDFDKVVPLFIDYGQLAASHEWAACQALLKECGLPEARRVDLSGYGRLLSSGITDKSKNIKEDAFLPGRNQLFISVGSALAYQEEADGVAIGLLSEKFHLFPDQTQEFIVNMNTAVNSALGKDITILTPLINFSKEDVIKLADKYKIPLSKTYSCHSGNRKYCGKCISCKEIIDSGQKDKFLQFNEGE